MSINVKSEIQRFVSIEQYNRIRDYIGILQKWNRKINLISRQMLQEEVYVHVLDSLALRQYIPDLSSDIVDIGSGNGLPGLILNIAGYSSCYLVERSSKKAAFLTYVIGELGLSAKVYNVDVKFFDCIKARYVVSKAVASIEAILDLTSHIRSENTTYLLHKTSAQLGEELRICKKVFDFKIKTYKNAYNEDAVILEITAVRKII